MPTDNPPKGKSDMPNKLTFAELGKIMLEKYGAEACKKAYDSIDPFWVGRSALEWNEINPDGTLN